MRAAAGALLLVCLAAPLTPAAAQTKPTTKPWNYGVIEPKGDAGFSLMVSKRGFAEKRGLNVKIVPLANGTLAHKALLAGEIDAIESSPGSAILAGLRGAVAIRLKDAGSAHPAGVQHADRDAARRGLAGAALAADRGPDRRVRNRQSTPEHCCPVCQGHPL